jgi:hypothetical protein
VDTLTGETTILRTDILYDCGKSLNPAIDLGQAKPSALSPILLLALVLTLRSTGQAEGAFIHGVSVNDNTPLPLPWPGGGRFHARGGLCPP